MADYSEDRAEAYESIKEAGAAMTLFHSEGAEYNPATCRTAPATVLDYPCYGIIEEYTQINAGMGPQDGSSVLAGDKKITLTAAADFPDPISGDTLTVGETVYKVVRVKSLAPAGVAILYEVQARV